MKQESTQRKLNKNLRAFAGVTTAVGASAGAGFLAATPSAQAQVTVISDNFSTSSNYGNSLIGTAPGQVNLPGGNYELVGSGFGDSQEYSNTHAANIGTVKNLAREHNGGGVGVSLGSYGTLGSAPLTFSAGLAPVPVGSGNTGSTYDFLGAGSTATTSNYSGPANRTDSIGIQLNGDGSLDYVFQGHEFAVGNTPATFDANGFATLSFTLTSTASGYITIGGIMLNGVSVSGSYTAGSVATNELAFAEFGGGGSANTGSDTDVTGVTNFDVTSGVPEPSTYALLAAGAVALGATQFRRRQQA